MKTEMNINAYRIFDWIIPAMMRTPKAMTSHIEKQYQLATIPNPLIIKSISPAQHRRSRTTEKKEAPCKHRELQMERTRNKLV
jgi:hypothetical protein